MSKHTVSGWEKASTVAACLEVIVVAVSLLFIWSQLRQQKLQLAQQTRQLEEQVRVTEAANTQAQVELITPLNLRRTERDMADLWLKGADGINKVSNLREREVKLQQYYAMVASYMVFYENAYSQCLAGLLNEEIYNGWEKDLAIFLDQHNIANDWNEWKKPYREDFGKRVDLIIASSKSNSTLPRQQCPP